LSNKKYSNLEVHGAATFSHVEVAGVVKVTGSTTWNQGSAGAAVDIYGALNIDDVELLGNLSVKGDLIMSKVLCANVVSYKGFSATDSTIDTMVSKGDSNRTIRFFKSKANTVNIEGVGDRIVIVNDTAIDTIVFENKGGVVRLLNNASVNKVVNGQIEENAIETVVV
jgi:hypothetical protein